jgi:hypothetical protein
MRITVIFLLIGLSLSAQSQIVLDTNPSDSNVVSDRYDDYSDQLLLKLMSVSKINKLEILNNNNNQVVKLKPYGISSLGVGFNYKWLGLGLAVGLPATAAEEEIYGKTDRFDFQLNIYSKKFVVDAFAQQYTGFHIENPKDLTDWNETYFPKRETMQTFSMGVGGYYVFNHKKLSYKAAYVRNAVQKKSAGSFLLGGFYNIDNAGFENGDTSTFIPSDFPNEVQDKSFFINVSLIPGIGSKNITVYKSDEKINETSAVGRFNGRVAIGYENKHFLIGLTSNTVSGTFKFRDYEIKPSTSNAKIFIAKRFNIKKKK